MALAMAQQQVLFSAAATVSVTAGSSATSDVFTPAATAYGKIKGFAKADNSTTAAADDIIHVWWLEGHGDPDADADSADEWVTTGHAKHLCVLDTYDEDPAICAFEIDLPFKNGKFYVEGATEGSTNSITCSIQITNATA